MQKYRVCGTLPALEDARARLVPTEARHWRSSLRGKGRRVCRGWGRLRSMSSRTFDGIVEALDEGPGAAVPLPFDAREVFGRSRAQVVVTFEGREPFHATVAHYGGRGWIALRTSRLNDLGLAPGDAVQVTVVLDASPRVVEEPVELAVALGRIRRCGSPMTGCRTAIGGSTRSGSARRKRRRHGRSGRRKRCA